MVRAANTSTRTDENTAFGNFALNWDQPIGTRFYMLGELVLATVAFLVGLAAVCIVFYLKSRRGSASQWPVIRDFNGDWVALLGMAILVAIFGLALAAGWL